MLAYDPEAPDEKGFRDYFKNPGKNAKLEHKFAYDPDFPTEEEMKTYLGIK